MFISVATWTLVLGVFAFWLSRQHVREKQARLLLTTSMEIALPPRGQHPRINPMACIGCKACMLACPESDVIEIINGTATLVSPGACIGHGACAAACPTGAIELVLGSEAAPVQLPRVTQTMETNRPGLFLAGDSGTGNLIKDAVAEGGRAARGASASIDVRTSSLDEGYDVIIVGAGPAGLAAAVQCKAHRLRFKVLERETVAQTITNYPRHKLVMTESLALPGYGIVARGAVRKEDFLTEWLQVVAFLGDAVHEHTLVEDVRGTDGAFQVHTNRGVLRGQKVIVAIGRQGQPRKLGAPGEERSKVVYRLKEATQYNGKRVLVVGGGDSAVESAIALAEESTATVCISYRRGQFTQCRAANRTRLDALIAAKKLHAFMQTEVDCIDEDSVVLRRGEDRRRIRNDFVIINAGGTPPAQFFQKVGIDTQMHRGTVSGEHVLEEFNTPGRIRWPRVAFALLSMAAIGAVLVVLGTGLPYYLTPFARRPLHALHASLRSAGRVGLRLGVLAACMIVVNTLYAWRKRSRRAVNLGRVPSWMNWHAFFGTLAPLVCALHAAFYLHNFVGYATAASLILLTATGYFGRFMIVLLKRLATTVEPPADAWEKLRSQILDCEFWRPIPGHLRTFESIFQKRLGSKVPPTASQLALETWRIHRAAQTLHAHATRHNAIQLPKAIWALQNTYARAMVRGAVLRYVRVWRITHAAVAAGLSVIIVLHIGMVAWAGYLARLL